MANKRQNIMDAVKTRLQGITVTNGYNYNLGSNVFEWKEKALSGHDLPALIYRDPACVKEESVVGKFAWRLFIEIEIHAQGSTAPADMRKMLADVYKAVGVDYTWGGLAINTEQPEGDEMQMEKEGNLIALALIKFPIIYSTPEWEN